MIDLLHVHGLVGIVVTVLCASMHYYGLCAHPVTIASKTVPIVYIISNNIFISLITCTRLTSWIFKIIYYF